MLFKKKEGFLKRIFSFLILLSFLVLAFSGCGIEPDEEVKTIEYEEGKSVETNFSELLLSIVQEDEMAQREIVKYGNEIDSFEDLKEARVNGEKYIDYLKDRVEDVCNKNLMIKLAAEKLNVKLTDAEDKDLSQKGYEYYKRLGRSIRAYNIGISQKTCEQFFRNNLLDQKIGEQLYGRGKEKEVKEEDIKKYGNDISKVSKYKFLSLPKNLETLKIKDCKEPKNEKAEDKEGKEKEEKEVKKEDEEKLVIEKFGVKTVEELANAIISGIEKDKNKNLDSYIKEISDAYKGRFFAPQEEVIYFEEEDADKNNFMNFNKNTDEIKKQLKEISPNDIKLVKFGEEIGLLKKISMDDETVKNENKKIRGILEKNIKKEYMDEIEKKYKDKIETNEKILSESIIEKQIKKDFHNRENKSAGLGLGL